MGQCGTAATAALLRGPSSSGGRPSPGQPGRPERAVHPGTPCAPSVLTVLFGTDPIPILHLRSTWYADLAVQYSMLSGVTTARKNRYLLLQALLPDNFYTSADIAPDFPVSPALPPQRPRSLPIPPRRRHCRERDGACRGGGGGAGAKRCMVLVGSGAASAPRLQIDEHDQQAPPGPSRKSGVFSMLKVPASATHMRRHESADKCAAVPLRGPLPQGIPQCSGSHSQCSN